NMDGSAPGPTQASVEFYSYPGKYDVPAEGARIAKLMADAFACKATNFHGTSDTARLVPAHIFKLTTDEGTHTTQIEGEYVVTSMDHDFKRANNDTEPPKLKVVFDALLTDTTFRPERKTPRPIIANPLTAVVTGPVGE